MYTLSDIFTFRISAYGRSIIATPYYEDLIFDFEDKGEVGKQRILPGELTFRGNDYAFLNTVKADYGVCGQADVTIEQGGQVRFTGVLTVGAGTWSERDATVSITPQSDDNYACFDRVLKNKENILTRPTVPPLRVIIGQLSERVQCTVSYQGVPAGNPPNLCLPDSIGWTLVQRDAVVTRDGDQYTTVDIASYQREEFTGANPPGGGWTEVSPGFFARPLFTRLVLDRFSIDPEEELDVFDLSQVYEVIGTVQEKLPDNGVLLSEVLSFLLGDCPYLIRSNFLNINPDGTAPQNRVYDNADLYQNLILFQKTDIKNTDADQNATRAEITLEELLDELALLEVYHTIEGNTLRLEHISYFNRNGLDVSEQVAPHLETDLEYDLEDIPPRETFSWMDSGIDPDFDGRDIVYPQFCSGDDERPVVSKQVSTNFADIQNNPENYVNEGFVIMSTFLYNGLYHINIGAPILGDDPVLNYPMAWSVIQDYLYRDNRPLPEGNMNGEDVVFDGSIPQAQQQEINVSLTYDEFFAFDPSRRVKTQLGWGRVVSSSYSCLNQQLTIQVAHE